MISILLVEDDAHKRTVLADAIYGAGEISEECVDIAVDVADAKRKLECKGYDLLLLDIHLPRRADKEPDPGGGLEVLRWLKTRGKMHRPPYIIGTTVHGASFELAQSEFDNLIWTVIAFSFSDNAWKVKLRSTLMTICDQITPPYSSDGVTHKTDLVIVTALESPELRAVLAFPLDWKPVKVRFDDARYFGATFSSEQKKYSIVAVAASDKGLSGAAIITTKAVQAFRPKYVAMVGICAGVKERIEMGDVIVADPSWDWGSGKTKLGTDGSEFFHPAQYQMRLDETLRSKASALRADPSSLHAAVKDFEGAMPPNLPQVHIGAVASGAAVLQSTEAVRRILEHHKDLAAVDMEIYSVMYACHVAGLPRPDCIAIKAVSDFGDSEKGDSYQSYASFVAVEALFALLPSMLD
ncbi:hypothetical protein [Parvibaculum sp.]|uniref:phosphorylase family protein n=1 Tax=Parvibaculum sp. TaxID=2024848 RepID=UPI001DD2D796|nr:hypothetical protein [Parvibaculum sp.]MBX3490324.1 hypothetical protein [Parvibaculum sp.]